jgi:hypothetical protein
MRDNVISIKKLTIKQGEYNPYAVITPGQFIYSNGILYIRTDDKSSLTHAKVGIFCAKVASIYRNTDYHTKGPEKVIPREKVEILTSTINKEPTLFGHMPTGTFFIKDDNEIFVKTLNDAAVSLITGKWLICDSKAQFRETRINIDVNDEIVIHSLGDRPFVRENIEIEF